MLAASNQRAFEFKLPDLGEGITEGEILAWHVAVGDVIEADAALVDIETDKAAVTIPTPRAGRVAALFGSVGETVRVGHVLAAIASDQDQPVEAVPAAEPPAIAKPIAVPPVAAQGRPVPAAPATRRLARELGVVLEQVLGTGPGGRVLAEDVRRAAAKPVSGAPTLRVVEVSPSHPASQTERPPSGPSVVPFYELEAMPDFSAQGEIERVALRSIRRRVAKKMVTTMLVVPHVAHMDEADVTELEAFRKRESERRQGTPGGHLTLLPFVIKAVTAGLKSTRSFNASLDHSTEEIVYKRYYNIGVAVDTEQGLIVPVVKGTDQKSIVQLSTEIEALAKRARQGEITLDELRGGTFTITNIGALGGTGMVPAINFPEVAILGMGRVQEKPVVRGGQVVIRKMLPLVLAFDHRVADGADAARFVNELVRQLSDPSLLLLET